MFKIRPFHSTAEEYARIVEINNALWPDELNTVENLKYDDEQRNPKLFFQRLILELDNPPLAVEDQGKIIGETWCGQNQWDYDPGRYFFGLHVDPHYRRLEYGENSLSTAVMTYLLNLLNERKPKLKLLTTHCREDRTDRLNFLKEQGFTQVMRFQESELEVTTFDPAPFFDKAQQVKAQGIEILSLPELKTRFGNWLERLYELDMETSQDEPSTGEFTPQPLEEYAKMFNHPSFLEEGWLIAVDGGQCVGGANLWNNQADPQKLHTGFTGVRRSHRRQGIATVLKLATIQCAQQRGATRIITENEENNPMYQINVKLGFKPRPASLEFHKKLK